MGTTLQQHRVAIGRWNTRKVKQIQASPDYAEMDERNTIDTLAESPTLKGPWKIHASLLCVILITTVMMHTAMCCNLATRNASALDHSLSTTNRHISVQCLKALLMIGGVELNPGPDRAQEEIIKQQEDVLAELCANAPNIETRDTLRLYDPRLDTKALERQINRASKTALVLSLEYLGQSGMNDYNKETCVTSLICRIQNLFPDHCSFCKEQYRVLLADTPLLSCKVCGQGAHDPCIVKHLQLASSDQDDLTPAGAWNMINPTKLPGLHYLCEACEKTTIPSEEVGKLKSKSKPPTQAAEEMVSSQAETKDGSKDGSTQSLANDTVEVNDPDDTVVESQEEECTQVFLSDDPPVNESSKSATSSQQDKQETVKTQSSTMTKQPNKMKDICSFYRKGTCRYGLSGKGCPREHPKPCKRLLSHGTKAPYGCTLGRDKCDSFHPKMCPTSIKRGECFKEDCKLKHVAGTKRTPPKNENVKDGQTQEKSADFLEELRLFKAQMMEAMELKFAMMISQQTASLPAPSHPPAAAAPYISKGPSTQVPVPQSLMSIAAPAPIGVMGPHGQLMYVHSMQEGGIVHPTQVANIPAGMNNNHSMGHQMVYMPVMQQPTTH